MSKIPDDDIILNELERERPARSVLWAFFFLAAAANAAQAGVILRWTGTALAMEQTPMVPELARVTLLVVWAPLIVRLL